MPGLVGFAGKFDPSHAQYLIQAMANAMKDHNWYQVDLYYGEELGLGRASLGLSNPEPQPIWNEDKTLCIIMEGELYDYQALKQELITRGHCFHIDNDAEFMLHLFEEYGKDFAIHLNGAFVAAIWNQREKEMVLVNDRLGLRPLYYVLYKGRFTFASGVRALLADPDLPRNVDSVAIAQMLSFEYILGHRTLLREVQLLPPASLLTLRNGQFTIRSYWHLQFSEVYQLRSREQYLEGFIHYLQQAVTRQMPGDLPAGLNLSGGLDSRMLLGLLCNGQLKMPLRTYTFGIHGCDDARIAKELANVAGTQHHFFELKPDYLLDLAGEGVRLMDGMESSVHMHALANVKAQARQVQILYTGFFADYLISPELRREWLSNYDKETAKQLIFDDINFLFRKTSKDDIYTKDFQRQFSIDFEGDFQARVTESKSLLLADWRDHFDIHQRQRRFTKQGDELLRSHVICRTPFCDNDLVEYTLSVPPGLRLDRFLFKEALVKLFHNLAKVPVDKTGLPMVPCARELYLRIDQQARWQLRKFGFKRVSDRLPLSYADYDSWVRTVLHGWVEEILLSKHALQRGYFNPTFIRNLVSLHMAGENYSRELGVLLSLELWHRQFLD